MGEFYGNKKRYYCEKRFEQEFRNVFGSPAPVQCENAEQKKENLRQKNINARMNDRGK